MRKQYTLRRCRVGTGCVYVVTYSIIGMHVIVWTSEKLYIYIVVIIIRYLSLLLHENTTEDLRETVAGGGGGGGLKYIICRPPYIIILSCSRAPVHLLHRKYIYQHTPTHTRVRSSDKRVIGRLNRNGVYGNVYYSSIMYTLTCVWVSALCVCVYIYKKVPT
jgi:hypothetical protein